MSLCKIHKLEYSKVEEEEYCDRLEHHDDGNSDHEFEVLGLMTDEQHCDEHRNASAKRREKKQGLFGCAELYAVLFRDLFIIDTDYDRDDRNYQDVGQKDREGDVVFDEFQHDFILHSAAFAA